jgi:hypothetical protein
LFFAHLGTRCSLKMSKNMIKRATENSMLKFLTVSSVSTDSIVKGIIDDIINTAVKTAEVDEQKTKYLQHFINKHDTQVLFNKRRMQVKCIFLFNLTRLCHVY